MLAVVLVVSVAGQLACNKGPARSALAETDQALAVVRPELERYAPSDLARITADGETARGLFAAGQYTEALRIAQRLPARIALASAKASTRKSELTPAWSGLSASLPASVEALSVRMAELDDSPRPHGFDPAAIDAAKAELARVQASWAQAESAFRTGDVREAVRIGTEAQASASALAARMASPQPSVPGVVGIPARSGAAPHAPRPRGTPKPVPAPETPETEPAAESTTPPATVPPGTDQR